jgi:uncharacterized membrane protein YadS
MGAYDVPLESVILFVSILLIYFAYQFHKNGGEAFKRPTKMFLVGFILLCASAVFDLLDEFYKNFIVDIAGEVLLIAAFAAFMVTLQYFRGLKNDV